MSSFPTGMDRVRSMITEYEHPVHVQVHRKSMLFIFSSTQHATRVRDRFNGK